jgi:hypothetical protein
MGHFGFNFGSSRPGTEQLYISQLKEGLKHGFKETKHPDSLG